MGKQCPRKQSPLRKAKMYISDNIFHLICICIKLEVVLSYLSKRGWWASSCVNFPSILTQLKQIIHTVCISLI